MEVSGQLHAPVALLPGKDRRLGGPQSQSGRRGEEKSFQPLPRLELPIIQLVAQRYTTELSRLLNNKMDLKGTYCEGVNWIRSMGPKDGLL
jgi:hypothetical protein